jgi:hypothetical protein
MISNSKFVSIFITYIIAFTCTSKSINAANFEQVITLYVAVESFDGSKRFQKVILNEKIRTLKSDLNKLGELIKDPKNRLSDYPGVGFTSCFVLKTKDGDFMLSKLKYQDYWIIKTLVKRENALFVDVKADREKSVIILNSKVISNIVNKHKKKQQKK